MGIKIVDEYGEKFCEYVNQISNCYRNKVHDGYTLCANRYVIWSESINHPKKQWGHVHFHDDRLEIDIDYPVHSYIEKEISDRLGLPVKKARQKMSGIRLLTKSQRFHTLEIVIFADDLESYNVLNESFKLLVEEIANRSCV